MLHFIIKDTGAAITQQQIDSFISRNYLQATLNAENKKGTGLGYLIVKDLLEMMGGIMKIISQINVGMTIETNIHN